MADNTGDDNRGGDNMDDTTHQDSDDMRPASSVPDQDADDEAPPDPEQLLRQQRVREKLQQMYGDDSAKTVRQFLFELTTGPGASEEPEE